MAKFPPDGLRNPRSEEVYKGLLAGHCYATSIGFTVLAPPVRQADGITRYPKTDMLEFSLCNVGQNQQARRIDPVMVKSAHRPRTTFQDLERVLAVLARQHLPDLVKAAMQRELAGLLR